MIIHLWSNGSFLCREKVLLFIFLVCSAKAGTDNFSNKTGILLSFLVKLMMLGIAGDTYYR